MQLCSMRAFSRVYGERLTGKTTDDWQVEGGICRPLGHRRVVHGKGTENICFLLTQWIYDTRRIGEMVINI